MRAIRAVLFAAVVLFVSFPVAMAQGMQSQSPQEVTQRVAEGRAVEAVIWGMPAVNFDLMLQAALKF